jgi:hypothetical protein
MGGLYGKVSNTKGLQPMTTKLKSAPQPETKRSPDLRDRLLTFTSDMLGLAGSLPDDRAGGHLSEMLLRSATAGYFRHGEAEGSPSAKEFTEKFRACLTELRVTRRALELLEASGIPCNGLAVRQGLEDVDILIRIFFSSLRTLEAKL